MSKILSNMAGCAKCGHVLYSTHRHDYRTHSCDPSIWFMVDGGKEYVRRGWGGEGRSNKREDHYIELSTYEE